jgi:hypothetical protein
MLPGRVISPDEANNLVPGCSYLPAQPEKANAASFLLLLRANGVHNAGFEIWHARRLMQRGCRMAHVALPYRCERRPPRLNFGAPVLTSDLAPNLTVLGQVVCDAADVLR